MAERSLSEFVEDAGGGSHLRVEHDFGGGFVRLRTSEAERRQAAQDIQCSENILLELLRNSKDAGAANIFVASSHEKGKRILTVVDDGAGIPESMHEHVFEPRVTSKLDTSHMDDWGLHGRGMALYSIRVNAEQAEVLASGEGLGCALRIVSDTTRLPEKKDQSTFPTFTLADARTVDVRGPKNLLRCACEFAIASRDSCRVHFGSPAEVLSSLFAYGSSTLSQVDRVFCSDSSALPVIKRPAVAADPHELASIADALGLEVSERTARRVLDGQVSLAADLLDSIVIQKAPQTRKRGKRRPSPKTRFQQEDLATLRNASVRAFGAIAGKYYLEGDVDPRVVTKPDRLVITIPLVPSDES